MRTIAPVFGWGGLNTKATATGLPLLECVHLQDMRVVGLDLVERLGISRVGQLTGTASAMDFVAASSMACANAIDTRVWALGLYWTVEIAIDTHLTGGTPGIFTAGTTTQAMELLITGGNLTFSVWDTNDDVVTTTVGAAAVSVQTVQVTRAADVLTFRLNNGTAFPGTMHATRSVRTPVGDLRVARDDAANYYDGNVDYLRLFSTVKSNHNDRLVRTPNPRAAHVLADYDFNATGTLVYDRSRYENHLIMVNTPTEVTTLCHNPAPVRALSMGVNTKTNRKELLMIAGGQYFIAEVN